MKFRFFLLLFLLSCGVSLRAQNDDSLYRLHRYDSMNMHRVMEMAELMPVFKKATDDSAFVVNYSDAHRYEESWFCDQFPENFEANFRNAKKGDVIGPCQQGNRVSIYKIAGKKMSVDSARVRHILITYKFAERADPSVRRKKWEAKALADSLCNVINSGKTPMTDLVLPFTDDPGSKMGNLGDYGWFTEESGFVTPFKDAGFNNPVGKTVVVETEYGYHVIQVTGRKKPQECITALGVERMIDREQEMPLGRGNTPGYKMAIFPGGVTAMHAYLQQNLRYPQAEKEKGTEGTIWVSFQISPEGKVENVVATSIWGAGSFTAEAVRLVSAMPVWTPASYNGKVITDYQYVAVPFVLH